MAANLQFNAVPNAPAQVNNVWDWLVGTKGQNISNLDPNQQAAIFQQLQQGMQNADFNGQEQAARRNFQTQTVPGLAERFTAMGAGGQRSSAFQGALGSAGANLESQLAALRSQYGLQQLQQGLTQHLEYAPGSEGFLQQSAGKAVDAGLAYASGGWGDLFGSTGSLGGDFSKLWDKWKSSGGTASSSTAPNSQLKVTPYGQVTGSDFTGLPGREYGTLGGPAASPKPTNRFGNLFSGAGF